MYKFRTIAAALVIGITSLGVVSTASAKEKTKSTNFDKPAKCVKLSKKGNKMRCKIVVGKPGVTGKDGTNGSNGVNGAPGANGNDGANGVGTQGPAGVNGKDGLNGVSGYKVMTWDYDNAGPGGIATVPCDANEAVSKKMVAVGGGFYIRNGNNPDMSSNMPSLSNGAGVVVSMPGRMDWSTNSPKPGRNDGWIVRFNDKGAGAVTLYAICVNAA